MQISKSHKIFERERKKMTVQQKAFKENIAHRRHKVHRDLARVIWNQLGRIKENYNEHRNSSYNIPLSLGRIDASPR